MEYQLISTKDKSNTIFLPELNEHYHSIHGALTESLHIYIKNGLESIENTKHINVLEVGFGTGLNAILTYLWANRNKIKVSYTTLEPFPIPLDIISKLNFKKEIPLSEDENIVFEALHKGKENKMIESSPYFHFTKRYNTFQDFKTNQQYQVIYYDAFAPEKQANMWTRDCYEKLATLLSSDGVIPTYCCKGDVKRGFKAAGLYIQKMPGPKNGKREMLRVSKSYV